MLNLANKITITRIILIPVFMTFLLSAASLNYVGIDVQWGAVVAGVVFVAAALTDTLDGYVARSRGEVTVIGQMLDPLADKLLVSAALISLVDLGRLSAWIAVLIIGRELAVTGLRMAAAVKHVVIPASVWGKAKTISQILAISLLIFKLPIPVIGPWLEATLLGVALFLTIISGVDYFRNSYDALLSEEEPSVK